MAAFEEGYEFLCKAEDLFAAVLFPGHPLRDCVFAEHAPIQLVNTHSRGVPKLEPVGECL